MQFLFQLLQSQSQSLGHEPPSAIVRTDSVGSTQVHPGLGLIVPNHIEFLLRPQWGPRWNSSSAETRWWGNLSTLLHTKQLPTFFTSNHWIIWRNSASSPSVVHSRPSFLANPYRSCDSRSRNPIFPIQIVFCWIWSHRVFQLQWWIKVKWLCTLYVVLHT